MQNFLAGITMMGYFTVGLYFLRFWSRTRDRLFACFSIGFFMMAVEKCFSFQLSVEEEPHSLIYLIRLFAFLIIIWGIVDKNRN